MAVEAHVTLPRSMSSPPTTPPFEDATDWPPELLGEAREVVAYYDALAPTYDTQRFGHTYGRCLDAIERSLLEEWRVGPRVLDIACGTGRLLDLASEGVDLSPEMVRQARSRWPGKPLHLAPAWRVPVPDGSFDTVFAMHFFMHLRPTTLRLIVDECWRLLRPGGLLVFDLPNALRRRRGGASPEHPWHAATTLEDVPFLKDLDPRWRKAGQRGIALAPIHRVPPRLRAALVPAERLLSRTPLKHLASYHLVKLEKRT